MNIRYLGHACFFVRADSGVKVVFDPYEPGGFGGGIGYGVPTEAAEVVIISHEHADHNFAAAIPGNPRVVKGAGVHAEAPFPLRGIALKHDASGGSQRGDNTVFCAEIDSVRLCHLGDLGHTLTAAQAAEIGPVDVLLCPVGGLFTVDAKEATRVVEALKARITIPMHFKTPKVGFDLAPVEDFIAGKKNVQRPKTSEIAVTTYTLPAGAQIIVLEPAL
jgi:L-ascorbate metabolism protein UlaG (beta-lactamase superfamily)